MFTTLVIVSTLVVTPTSIIILDVISPCNGTPITADTIIIPLYIVTPTITIIYCVVGANAAIIVDVIVGANAAIAVIDDVVVVIGAVAAIIIIVVCIVAIVVVVIVVRPTIPPLLGGILPTPRTAVAGVLCQLGHWLLVEQYLE